MILKKNFLAVDSNTVTRKSHTTQIILMLNHYNIKNTFIQQKSIRKFRFKNINFISFNFTHENTFTLRKFSLKKPRSFDQSGSIQPFSLFV